MTDRQFRSLCTTTFATLRWTKISPGRSPRIWFAGTRLSEQPIHKYRGACCRARRAKKSGSEPVMRSAHDRLRSSRTSRVGWSVVICALVRPGAHCSCTAGENRHRGVEHSHLADSATSDNTDVEV